MCGLNGIFAYDCAVSAPAERELIATRDAMRSRGPDGSGTWWSDDRRCGFGHRRLSILDLSNRASQPMVSCDGRAVVVFNGEIYNYPMLREELEADGARFRTTSDTEVLLHLYARDGADMVHRLRGMFAFAIWDGRRRGVLLARDPYGIKPLYTVNNGKTFRFASQVKALLSGRRVSRDMEPAGVVGFLLFGSVPEPYTFYNNIRALPSGHTQWVDATGAHEPKPFFNIATVLAEGAKYPASLAELRDRVRTAVLDSVRVHLLADVEVGLFLSAGVDSGALLGLMRDAGQRDTRAITLAFKEFHGTAEDETPCATQVARHYMAQHIVRYVSERQFRDDLPIILDAMDQPSIDGVNTWFVAKAAKEIGIKVAISGIGGDELLAGYPSFTDIPRWHRRFGQIAAVPGLGKTLTSLMKVMVRGSALRRPKAAGLFRYADSWAGAYLLRRGLFLPEELTQLLEPDLVREGLSRLKPLDQLSSHLLPDPGTDTGRICVLESGHYMRNQLLRDADWAGMAHGIEIRVPLVDVGLLGALSPVIPGLSRGSGKAALANAPSMVLPAEILNRAKSGFGVPTGAWISPCRQKSSFSDWAHGAKGQIARSWAQLVFEAHEARPGAAGLRTLLAG
jgi:asparagine synthase (glutamine-hydrolysing)